MFSIISKTNLVDAWLGERGLREMAHQSNFQHLLKDGQFMDSDGVGV